MNRFWRVFLGLNGTDASMRQSIWINAVLTVVWLGLFAWHLAEGEPFAPSHFLLSILPLIVAAVSASSGITKAAELRRRSRTDAATSDLLG